MKSLFVAVGLILSLSVSAQPIRLLLGQKESYVTLYLDSLSRLNPVHKYYTERSTSHDGDLMLSVDFDANEEIIFNCISIIARFSRVDGEEICMSQMIIGSQTNASSNINFIKDHFRRVEEGKWEHPFSDKTKITVTYEKGEDGIFKGYTIYYSFKSI